MIRSNDRQLIEQAELERCILLTENKDFGWLISVSHTDLITLIKISGSLVTLLESTPTKKPRGRTPQGFWSYWPEEAGLIEFQVGGTRLELVASTMSTWRSSQLS